MKEAINRVSIHKDLDEKFFQHRAGIHFAQLDYQMCQKQRAILNQAPNANGGQIQEEMAKQGDRNSFIQRSSVVEMFYCFVNGTAGKSRAMIEFILWKYLCQMHGTSHGDMALLHLTNDTKPMEFQHEALNSELKARLADYEDFKSEDALIDIKEEFPELVERMDALRTSASKKRIDYLYSLEDVRAISAYVKEASKEATSDAEVEADDVGGVGVMFYYGDSRIPKSKHLSNELMYKPFLLQNAIIGLSCLQHKGSMILKLYETETQFTVGLMFILFSLFESILIFKPYSTSPLSSSQYLVCKGMKSIQAAKAFAGRLEVLYGRMLEHIRNSEAPDNILDFPAVVDLNLLEDEDQLNQCINASNNANWTMRADIIQLALANHTEFLKVTQEVQGSQAAGKEDKEPGKGPT